MINTAHNILGAPSFIYNYAMKAKRPLLLWVATASLFPTNQPCINHVLKPLKSFTVQMFADRKSVV